MKRLELTFFVYCFRELIFFRKIDHVGISIVFGKHEEENVKKCTGNGRPSHPRAKDKTEYKK